MTGRGQGSASGPPRAGRESVAAPRRIRRETAPVPTLTRADVLAHRLAAQQLDREAGSPQDTAVLDLGVQDHRTDGYAWALANRGCAIGGPAAEGDGTLVLLWTWRGAPHAYRRADAAAVLGAVAPWSSADAGRRIYDAAKPLRLAGLDPLEGLEVMARTMREIVTGPMVKGEVSARLARVLPECYLRWCEPCGARHPWEMTFRLGATRAGLELVPGTSPPVLRPIPGLDPFEAVLPGRGALGGSAGASRAGTARDRADHPGRGDDGALLPPGPMDPLRAFLHLYGPAGPRHVTAFLEAPLAEVTARRPADAREVDVEGERRWLLEADAEAWARRTSGRGVGPGEVSGGGGAGPEGAPGRRAGAGRGGPDRTPSDAVRLLGPTDPFLQLRDRELLVPDAARRRTLWPTLGRPGAILAGREVVGVWRPRARGTALRLEFDWWTDPDPLAEPVAAQAERLATSRGLTWAG